MAFDAGRWLIQVTRHVAEADVTSPNVGALIGLLMCDAVPPGDAHRESRKWWQRSAVAGPLMLRTRLAGGVPHDVQVAVAQVNGQEHRA